ncbi:MAG: L,D-transpeptidase family protein, partial [Patescibacteria group bacterium]
RYALFLPSSGSAALELTYGSWPALQDVQFFDTVKASFVDQGVDFIEADLSSDILRLYREGRVVREIAVLSKGKEGSWWETPAGLYKVQGKEPSHFSTLGQVFMPWSMPFQGNFFIHGWPTYPDGSSVPAGYSGGCIRLSTEDAKWLYEEAKTGTPILVFKKDFEGDAFAYEVRAPQLQAQSYLAADLKSDFVLAEKVKDKVMPIASLTKLMTALVATEYINIEKEITIQKEMLITTSHPRLKVGESVRVFDLLNLLLRESSNEAAEALARGYYGGEKEFVRLMNEKAKAIGMRDTQFADPSGVSADNTSNTRDLFVLARYLYNNRRFVLSLSRGVIDNQSYGKPAFDDIDNYNVFMNTSEFVGGKVGLSSSAQGTLLSVFEMTLNGEKRPLVMVILGSSNYEDEGKNLLTWIKNNY